MKRLRLPILPLAKNEAGFIPMLLSILALVVLIIVFVYARVQNAQ